MAGGGRRLQELDKALEQVRRERRQAATANLGQVGTIAVNGRRFEGADRAIAALRRDRAAGREWLQPARPGAPRPFVRWAAPGAKRQQPKQGQPGEFGRLLMLLDAARRKKLRRALEEYQAKKVIDAATAERIAKTEAQRARSEREHEYDLRKRLEAVKSELRTKEKAAPSAATKLQAEIAKSEADMAKEKRKLEREKLALRKEELAWQKAQTPTPRQRIQVDRHKADIDSADQQIKTLTTKIADLMTRAPDPDDPRGTREWQVGQLETLQRALDELRRERQAAVDGLRQVFRGEQESAAAPATEGEPVEIGYIGGEPQRAEGASMAAPAADEEAEEKGAEIVSAIMSGEIDIDDPANGALLDQLTPQQLRELQEWYQNKLSEAW